MSAVRVMVASRQKAIAHAVHGDFDGGDSFERRGLVGRTLGHLIGDRRGRNVAVAAQGQVRLHFGVEAGVPLMNTLSGSSVFRVPLSPDDVSQNRHTSSAADIADYIG
jgi:hypothetical protein